MTEPIPAPVNVVDDPSRPRKAIVAGIISALAAGLSALVVAQGDNIITGAEWTTVALAVFVAAGGAFGGTFAVPNPKVKDLGNSLRGRSL